MSEPMDANLAFHEAAMLPPTDPARVSLEQAIERMNDAERSHWTAILAANDALREGLADVAMPRVLTERLMEIPLNARVPFWKRPIRVGIRQRVALAAMLLLAAGVYLYWPRPKPDVPRELDAATAGRLAHLAISDEQAGTFAAIHETDPAKVTQFIQPRMDGLPVMILSACSSAKLIGGGVSAIAGAPAAVTLWQDGPTRLTLYQVDSAKLGTPRDFLQTLNIPRDTWTGAKHYHALIWPGLQGQCTWILVSDSDDTDSKFYSY